uniref:Uncharacterized protein n=1 Tax=Glossina palpalis gambiensis TaxID=67801 RepID=A0A1B0BBQ5_9MUSC
MKDDIFAPSGVPKHHIRLRLAHCRANDLLHNQFRVLCVIVNEIYNTLDSSFSSCKVSALGSAGFNISAFFMM